MHAYGVIQTGRLILRPVGGGDLADLTVLKGDPRAFALMLGGVRTPVRAAEELAEDIAFWGRRGFGMWSIRLPSSGLFVGLTGLMERADGRGVALRFALMPGLTGLGYASEAAGAALRFGHREAGLERVVAVARETNIGSRQVLGSIGMRQAGEFERDGYRMVLFESVIRLAGGR